MELKDALMLRRSVRKFTEEPVSDEMINELLHAAMSGPSACNKMPWKFYVITNKEKMEELRGTTRFTRMNAPLAIVVCGDLKKALPLKLAQYWIQDCSAATENILLRATDLSLGAVWCGIYPQNTNVTKLRKTLDIPSSETPLNIIFIGHPAQFPEARDQYSENCVKYIK